MLTMKSSGKSVDLNLNLKKEQNVLNSICLVSFYPPLLIENLLGSTIEYQ